MAISVLSDAQKPIYEMAQRGCTITEIAVELNFTESVVTAQITRIRKKTDLTHPAYAIAGIAGQKPVQMDMDRTFVSNPHDKTPLKPLKDSIAERAVERSNVHPMVLLSIGTQLVKLCGSRIHAHQLVEDIYKALRIAACDSSPPTEGAILPWLRDLEAENAELKDSMIVLKQELADLQKAFQEDQMAGSRPKHDAGNRSGYRPRKLRKFGGMSNE